MAGMVDFDCAGEMPASHFLGIERADEALPFDEIRVRVISGAERGFLAQAASWLGLGEGAERERIVTKERFVEIVEELHWVIPESERGELESTVKMLRKGLVVPEEGRAGISHEKIEKNIVLFAQASARLYRLKEKTDLYRACMAQLRTLGEHAPKGRLTQRELSERRLIYENIDTLSGDLAYWMFSPDYVVIEPKTLRSHLHLISMAAQAMLDFKRRCEERRVVL